MKVNRIVATLVLVALLLANTGCPRREPPEVTFEDMYINFVYDLKGLCLWWFRDRSTLNPNIIYITIPHLTSFFWTPGVIGNFAINNDQVGQNEFIFNFVSNGSFGFIDFGFSGTFTSGDIRVNWNPTMTRFEIIHPFGGFGIEAGYYYLTFFPGLIPISGNDPYWDVTIEMIGEPSELAPEGLTVRRNALMCMNSCIMPHIGFAALTGLVLGTDYVLYNVNPVENRVSVRYYNQNGSDAQVTVGKTTSNVHTVTVGPRSSMRVRPSVSDPGVKVVWALAWGTWPISCALDFSARDGIVHSGAQAPATAAATDLLGEAGIAASGVDKVHVLNIIKTSHQSPALGMNTALAIANPTSAPATIQATLLDSNDQQVQAATLPVLAGKNQVA